MNDSSPDVTIVVPFYNRTDTLPYTMESVRPARTHVRAEVVIVDDGSTPPAADTITHLLAPGDRIIRQENRGLLYARLTGLEAARGRYVLFLDSDDLIGPEKLRLQIAAMDRAQAPVSYTDTARTQLSGPYDRLGLQPDQPAVSTDDAAEFFLTVQPAPHSPVFATEWLRAIVAKPLFPPSAAFNAVAEIWFYHIASVHAARVVYVPGPHTIVGVHSGSRLTGHWERLAIASLAVMEAFAAAARNDSSAAHAFRHVGQRAFEAWRRLPYDFPIEFQRRLLAVWCAAPRSPVSTLGGGKFRLLARLVGPYTAGRLFRRLQRPSYVACRTVEDPAVVHQWLREIPPPPASLR